MSFFKGEFCSELNSEDKNDQDIPMSRNRALGGTMVLWKKSLDKYISVHPSSSPSFLPVIFRPPGSPVSVHLAIYLPTSGKEVEFLEQIILLSNCLDDISNLHGDCLIYIRGDANVNTNNRARCRIFSSFLAKYRLVQTPIKHKTYHHFLGGGAFDSNIDVISHSEDAPFYETITKVFCKLDYPGIDSHHDVIASAVSLPVADLPPDQDNLKTAPKLDLLRQKIIWSEKGIMKYQEEVASKLSEIRQRWLTPSSKTSLSILLDRTNHILKSAAISTNKSIALKESKAPKSCKKPKAVKESEILLRKAHRISENKNDIKEAKKRHRAVLRKVKSDEDNIQNEKLFSIISSNPNAAFRTIKKAKTSSSVQVPYIKVGDKVYHGDRVIDGLFESISNLKTAQPDLLAASPHHSSLMQDYENIKILCSNKCDLPPISMEKSSSILRSIKPGVSDIYSITANHYVHAGAAGFIHFNLL